LVIPFSLALLLNFGSLNTNSHVEPRQGEVMNDGHHRLLLG
jgi:hypothetical protein